MATIEIVVIVERFKYVHVLRSETTSLMLETLIETLIDVDH